MHSFIDMGESCAVSTQAQTLSQQLLSPRTHRALQSPLRPGPSDEQPPAHQVAHRLKVHLRDGDQTSRRALTMSATTCCPCRAPSKQVMLRSYKTSEAAPVSHCPFAREPLRDLTNLVRRLAKKDDIVRRSTRATLVLVLRGIVRACFDLAQ